MGNSAKRNDLPGTDFAKRTHRLSLADLRDDYLRAPLSEQNCETNPIVQFEHWFQDVQASHLKEPNAMTLATATAGGRPSARVVLLKEVSDLGFVFYTNYGSRKAQEIETNPFAALTFHWPELGRQVRVEGEVRRVPGEQSAAYFRSRPKGSQVGAWASRQSEVLPNREVLEAKWLELQEKYSENVEVPVPEFWGGYCVVPETVEFWEGRPNRLHDRLRYRRKGEDGWLVERLSP
ncbi:MAG TPA: pyridoxamine 5'-phosphate oxidase [Bryobacteraceae bacterium]|jgi:pyridoxamine 5'-phosphate oxidase|nr:pyridoxamine 5'-phosphate oxidase [Bryobacteraceae bacterium]